MNTIKPIIKKTKKKKIDYLNQKNNREKLNDDNGSTLSFETPDSSSSYSSNLSGSDGYSNSPADSDGSPSNSSDSSGSSSNSSDSSGF